MAEDRCFVCDALLKGLTTTCAGCGSVYRRGDLISEGKLRPRAPPTQKSTGREPKCPTCGLRDCPKVRDIYHHTFESWQSGKTREEAIERMFDDYDKHPGRRRLPARESFEVVQARCTTPLGKSDNSFWVIYVRKRRVADAEPETKAELAQVSPHEGRRGRHPSDCGCSRHRALKAPG